MSDQTTTASKGEREQVVSAIRSALGRGSPSKAERDTVARRLADPTRNVVPARGRQEGVALIDQFVSEAERVNAVVRRVETWEAVSAAVATFLREANLEPRLKLAPDPAIAAIPWAQEPMLSVSTGAAAADDPVAVTAAYAGIGETGTVMLLSGVESPTNLNFLPEVHVVVLPTTSIVGTYEDAWECLRGADASGVMPRVVNWVTGPSRTADIEQTLLLGAHGPKQLLIVLVDAESWPSRT